MGTLRQEAAIKELVANGGSVAKAMRKVGYSKKTARTPKKLTQSKGFQDLLNEEIPESLLLKVHREGLNAGKKVFKNNNESGEIELVSEEPDFAVRHKYLETGYKVRGKLKDNDPKGNTYNTVVFAGEQAERIARRILARNQSSEEEPNRLPNSDKS